MAMQYMIVTEEEGIESVKYIKGTCELEWLTDSRILTIYKAAILIYKLYGNNAAILKEEAK